jgi:HSP20 family protein
MAEKTNLPVKTGGGPLRRWDPFEMFNEMQQDMARFWGSGWPFTFRPFRPVARESAVLMPSVDVYEKNGNLIVKTELPGIKKEDISITLEGDDLVIRGERKSESEVKQEDYYRMERTYGSFYRRLPLPFAATADQIVATATDGVLEIQIPKPPEAKPETKEIKVT